MVLKILGYWLGAGQPNWPAVEAFIDETWDVRERDGVIDWLDSGVELVTYRGYSNCRICGRRNGSSELTDGVYLWPEGLVHYVRDHGVRLPLEVVRHGMSDPKIDTGSLEVAKRNDAIYVDDQWRQQNPDWKTQ